MRIDGNDELTQETNVSFEVFSSEGLMIMEYSGALKEAAEILNKKLSALTAGAYLLKIKSEHQNYLQKFLKN